jgi:hypothetical protein|tara:strand:- start:311 stop:781 length:471 start_codon:yes stop_codon:yes gene_type:complete
MKNIPKDLSDRLLFETPTRNGPDTKDPIVNNTLPLELKEIVYDISCEDCNMHLNESRVVQYKRLRVPYKYWTSQCLVCKNYKCPITNEYNLNNVELRNQHNIIAGKKPKTQRQSSTGKTLGRPRKETVLNSEQQFMKKIGRPPGAKNKPKCNVYDK